MLTIQRPKRLGGYKTVHGIPNRIDQKYPFDDMRQGDRLYLSDSKAPGHLVTVRNIAARKGLDVRFVPVDGGLYVHCVGRV
mgnify:CR=1 FL=1